ncbi:MAG: hypothetical protein WBH45_00145, partial [Acidobacteriaceae bacterium]
PELWKRRGLRPLGKRLRRFPLSHSSGGELDLQNYLYGFRGQVTLISGIKTKAALEFDVGSPQVRSVKLLRVVFTSPHGSMNYLDADFRDVPVQAR